MTLQRGRARKSRELIRKYRRISRRGRPAILEGREGDAGGSSDAKGRREPPDARCTRRDQTGKLYGRGVSYVRGS